MHEEIKNRKSSSREVKSQRKERNTKKNIYTKKKESLKLFTSYNNTSTESKTLKKQSNNKLNLINLKNIIKKIDLFAISLSTKNNNMNIIKNKYQKNKDKYNKLFTNFIKVKNNKIKGAQKFEKQLFIKNKKYTKKNSPENILKYTNIESLTASENRYNKKDFISRYNEELNNKKNKNNFYPNYSNINKLSNINKNQNDYLYIKKRENKQKNKKKINKSVRYHFKRNYTELGKLAVDSKNNISNNNSNISSRKNISKKNSVTKIGTASNSTLKLKEINNNKNNGKNRNLIKEEFKQYILKGKSAPKKNSNINKKKLYLISHENKLKPKLIFQKDNFKKNIPKPSTSHIDLKLKKDNQIQTTFNKKFNTEIFNGIENILSNTSSTYFKENEIENIYDNFNNTNNNKQNKENYIDNALINIRGISIPGKDTKNQIKLNQDSYIIRRDINNIKNFNIFGVFDGHGLYGHSISIYLKENLIQKIVKEPEIISLNNLEDIYKKFKKDNFKIIKDIFNEIDNQLLNKQNEIDINLSGSTCNIIIQIGDHLICANTGDSRSILIYEDKNRKNENDKDNYNNYKVFPLSFDCKPFLSKEKERILKKGGEIYRLKDSNQKEFGPLRVFIKGSLFPGLGMSRSFGDKLGKNIGIIVEPLINEYNLNKDVKYIIIASDGIWEFMNNEQVMNIGNKYYIMNDPDTFCHFLVKKSTELWGKNSRNIDDITIIVIFFTFL